MLLLLKLGLELISCSLLLFCLALLIFLWSAWKLIFCIADILQIFALIPEDIIDIIIIIRIKRTSISTLPAKPISCCCFILVIAIVIEQRFHIPAASV